MIKQIHINKYWIAFLILWILCNYSFYQITTFDGVGRLVAACSLITLFYYRNNPLFKSKINSTPVRLWILLMVYHLANSFLFYRSDLLEEYGIGWDLVHFVPLMIFVSVLYEYNQKLTYRTLLCSLYICLFFAYLFGSIGEDDGRLSGFIYTTQLGQMAGITCLVISMYVVNNKLPLSYCLLYVFPILIMILSGSRNSLLIVVFAFLSLFVGYIQKRNLIKIIILFLLIYLLMPFLENTLLFERLKEAETTNEAIEYSTNTFWDIILGDRVLYYVIGWMNFLEHPINGIGLLNFSEYNNYKYPIHAEFLTHLVEGGVIAVIMFISFYYSLAKFHIKRFFTDNIFSKQNTINFVCLIFLGLTARLYQYEMFFIIYGLMLVRHTDGNLDNCNL